MRGTHSRQTAPEDGKQYVAGVDVAGRVVEDGKPILNDRDETVITIAEVRAAPNGRRRAGDTMGTSQGPERPGRPVVPAQANSWWAAIRVVAHYSLRGLTHLQQYEQAGILLPRCGTFRESVDATGIGAGLASYLIDVLGIRVDPIVFTQKSKSELGFAMLAAAQTGRIRVYEGNGAEDTEEFFRQLANITYKLQAHETMAWEAADGGHDDYVASLALCVKAANETLRPR